MLQNSDYLYHMHFRRFIDFGVKSALINRAREDKCVWKS